MTIKAVTSTAPVQCDYTFQSANSLSLLVECPICHREIKSIKQIPGSFTAKISHEGVNIEKTPFKWPDLEVPSVKYVEIKKRDGEGHLFQKRKIEFEIENHPLFKLVQVCYKYYPIENNPNFIPKFRFYVEFLDSNTATIFYNHSKESQLEVILKTDISSTSATLDTTDHEKVFTLLNEFLLKTAMPTDVKEFVEEKVRYLKGAYPSWKRCYDEFHKR